MAEYSRTYGMGRAPRKTVKTRAKPGVVSEEAREKQARATELRAAGASYGEIAQVLGYHDASGAKKAVEAAIRAFQFESTKEALLLDLARLDEWTKLCTHRLRTSGDLSQIDRLMRIQDKRHYLLGVTPATLAETQPDGGAKTAGGMNVVVASSERVFVRAMMQAVGQDPDSPEGRAYLAARGLSDDLALPSGVTSPDETKPVKTRSRRLRKKKSSATHTSGKKPGASSHTPTNNAEADVSPRTYSKQSDNNEIVDAELVSTVKDDVARTTARAISVRTRDEEQVEHGVVRLNEQKI